VKSDISTTSPLMNPRGKYKK